jgi:hypothetical protein
MEEIGRGRDESKAAGQGSRKVRKNAPTAKSARPHISSVLCIYIYLSILPPKKPELVSSTGFRVCARPASAVFFKFNPFLNNILKKSCLKSISTPYPIWSRQII